MGQWSYVTFVDRIRDNSLSYGSSLFDELVLSREIMHS